MEQDLVERARNGDREAFGQLAAREIDRLVSIARLVLRDPDLADDAVQEALVRCWRQLPKLREVDRFEAWLYRILMRTAADEYDRRRRHEASVRHVRLEPRIGDSAATIADRDELDRGFRRLSVEHRAIIVLHHYLDLPLPAAADVLGIPPGTAKSRYHYAMTALRAGLEAEARGVVRGEVPA
jgi:RNA polymerase sigma-70 factor (ECF subfamily)